MRAVKVREYGGTPAVAEIPTPEPGARQILIRLRAAGMNPMDLWLASGAWKPMPAAFPMVLGADGAGVVESSAKVRRGTPSATILQRVRLTLRTSARKGVGVQVPLRHNEHLFGPEFGRD